MKPIFISSETIRGIRNGSLRKDNVLYEVFTEAKGGKDKLETIQVGDIFTLMDENDQEQEIEVLGTLNIDGTTYAAVAFVDDINEATEEDINVFFLKGENKDELSIIEDDDEFEKVAAAFKEAEEE